MKWTIPELRTYFTNLRWKAFFNTLRQLGIAFLIGLLLWACSFYPIVTGLQGAVLATLANAIAALWLKKGMPNLKFKSLIYVIQVILFAIGWSIIFQFKIDAFISIWEIGTTEEIVGMSLFVIFVLIFANKHIEAFIFKNLDDFFKSIQAFWNRSQAWNIEKQIWIRSAVVIGMIAIFIATFSYLNYGF